jgi:hypothetical protein
LHPRGDERELVVCAFTVEQVRSLEVATQCFGPVAGHLQRTGRIADEQRHGRLERDRPQVRVRGRAPVAERVLRVAEQVPRRGTGGEGGVGEQGRGAVARLEEAVREVQHARLLEPRLVVGRLDGEHPVQLLDGQGVGAQPGVAFREEEPLARGALAAAQRLAQLHRCRAVAALGEEGLGQREPGGGLDGEVVGQAQVLALDRERPRVHGDAAQPERRVRPLVVVLRGEADGPLADRLVLDFPDPVPVNGHREPRAVRHDAQEPGRSGGLGHRGPVDEGHLVVVEHEVEPPRSPAAGEQAVVVLVARPAEEQPPRGVAVRGVRLHLRLDDGVGEAASPGERLPGEVPRAAHLEAVGAALVARRVARLVGFCERPAREGPEGGRDAAARAARAEEGQAKHGARRG